MVQDLARGAVVAEFIASLIDWLAGDAQPASRDPARGQVDELAVFALHPVGVSSPCDPLFARDVRLAAPTGPEGRGMGPASTSSPLFAREVRIERESRPEDWEATVLFLM